MTAVTMITGTAVIAVLGYHCFVTDLSNFLGFLLVVLIAWSAINLTDFYAVRHGRYDVAAFFDPDGGPYGKVAWRGIAAVVAGFAAESPFVHQTYWTGPLVGRLGGADISWIVGFIVAGRRLPVPGHPHPPGKPGKCLADRPRQLADPQEVSFGGRGRSSSGRTTLSWFFPLTCRVSSSRGNGTGATFGDRAASCRYGRCSC